MEVHVSLSDIVTDFIRIPCDRIKLSVRCSVSVSFYQYAVLVEFVNPESSLLSFIIEIHGVDRSGVKYVMQAIKHLRSVNVSEKNSFIFRRNQGFSRYHRFKIRKERCLSGFHIATRDCIMCHENRCIFALCSQCKNHIRNIFRPCKIFFVCR